MEGGTLFRVCVSGNWQTEADASSINCTYIGSVNSNRFHYAICGLAKRIRPENRICFNSSEDVKKRGYIPCAACLPV